MLWIKRASLEYSNRLCRGTGHLMEESRLKEGFLVSSSVNFFF